ncbi:hypothetical protein BN8_01679 [Fibrisoma limi BUZ 3]|uniref:DUF4270 family protein n=1 Tax=Fibrisoma limi BUZ 3 TaxID=1185876 RepID=I2GFI9_9BACT|nr:DUF4270 family protein [Fibrisoma limi]CCH52664.1 hypothetical protein BN8_01679 [Fibrisoma limi BUZ 3]
MTRIHTYLSVSLIAIIFTGCQSGDLTVGQQIVTPRELDVQLVDSVTVLASTVLADTFTTSADSSVLIGRWADPQAGQTTAKGFVSLGYATHSLPDQQTVRFDSLVLVLPLGTAYGDTSQLLTLNVHQLRAKLDDQTYSNLDAAAYEPTPLLTKTFRPWPRYGSRQVRIRLPNALSQDFFDKLRNRVIIDEETMDAYWKGLALLSDPSTNLLLKLGISSAEAGLVLYYHDTDLNQTRSTIRFDLTGTHFSQVAGDRTGTPLSNLRTRLDAVSSRLTQNTAFIAAGAMLRARLEIPGLTQLVQTQQYRGINRADLILEPIRRDRRDNAAPPSRLVLFQTNSLNETLSIVPDAEGSSSTVVGYYGYDPNDLEQQAQYTFNITYYVNEILKARLPNRPLLLQAITETNSLPLERLTFGDAFKAGYRLRLRLYMTLEKP